MDDKKPNEKLNPSAKDYGEKTEFSRLLDAEKGATGQEETQEQAPDAQGVKYREEAPRGTQGLYRPSEGGPGGKAKVQGMLKKKGPLGLIIGLIVGGGFGVSFLFSPSILLVQIKETMLNKFNTQLASMDTRYNHIIRAKTSQATKGLCSGVKARCRYATMSERQINKFKRAGITIETEGKSISGRSKVTGFRYGDGPSVPASEFSSRMKTDANFRSAVIKGYNPKFAGFSDKVWTRVKAKFGLKEGSSKPAKDAEERKKNIHESSKETVAGGDTQPIKDGDKNPACNDPNNCTADDVKRIEADNQKAKTSVSESGKSKINESVKNVKGLRLGSAISITGYIEYACQAYGMIKLTANIAKTVRNVQLARYAMEFMSTADKIKAGDATPEDVSQLGEILTTASPGLDSFDQPRKSATDSFGYRYAAYGDTNMTSEYTTQFISGGGFGGSMTTVLGMVSTIVGGRKGASGTCGFLANPIVQAGTIIAGVASIFTGVGVAKIATQAAIGITIGIAVSILPGIIGDIIAGNVTDGIQGEDAGDAIASGAGGFMSATASAGGNSPLTKKQALAYNKLQTEVANRYTKDEAIALSPFDASNKYTFMGSIAYSLLPYYSSSAFSLKGLMSSSVSVLGSSFGSIIPKASAVNDAKEEEALNMCQDYDYVDLGIAADPFCNPIFGIPAEYLDADPIEIVDYLKDQGFYEQTGSGETADYSKTEAYNEFIANCIERTEPFGYEDVNASGGPGDGADCMIDNKLKAYAYINFIDDRVETGMDEFGDGLGGDTGSTGPVDCANAAGNAKIVCVAQQYFGAKYCFVDNRNGHLGTCGHGSTQWLKDIETHGKDSDYYSTDCSGYVNIVINVAFGSVVDSCSSGYAANTANFKTIPLESIQPGDLVIQYPDRGCGTANHVAIVESYNPSTKKLVTLESSAGTPDGGSGPVSGRFSERKLGTDFRGALRYIGTGST